MIGAVCLLWDPRMLDENEAGGVPTQANGAAPSPDRESDLHRERVIRAKLERRVELFDRFKGAHATCFAYAVATPGAS